MITTQIKDKNTGVVNYWTYTSSQFAKFGDILLIPVVNGVYAETTFGTVKANTPNGYVPGQSMFVMAVAQTVEGSSYRNSYGTYFPFFCGMSSYQLAIPANQAASCIPLRSMAEQYFNFGLTKRADPIEQG